MVPLFPRDAVLLADGDHRPLQPSVPLPFQPRISRGSLEGQMFASWPSAVDLRFSKPCLYDDQYLIYALGLSCFWSLSNSLNLP